MSAAFDEGSASVRSAIKARRDKLAMVKQMKNTDSPLRDRIVRLSNEMNVATPATPFDGTPTGRNLHEKSSHARRGSGTTEEKRHKRQQAEDDVVQQKITARLDKASAPRVAACSVGSAAHSSPGSAASPTI